MTPETTSPLMRAVSLWTGIGVAAVAAGCGQDGPPEAGAGGSAPVDIVEPAEMSVGTAEGAETEEFYNVRDPFLLEGGELVVPVAGHREIRVFNQDGEKVRQYGGGGEGPGEFRGLLQAWPRGDTVEVWDGLLSRMTRFPPEGDPEVVSLREGDAPLSTVVGVLDDGWLVGYVRIPSPGARDELVADRFNGEGERVEREVVAVSGMQRVAYLDGGGGPGALSPRARFQFGSSEESNGIYTAETLTPEVRVLDPETGDTLRTISWDPPDTPGPEEAFERLLSEARERGVEDERSVLGEGAPPDTVPSFSDFLVDEEGLVWVRPFVPKRDARGLGGNVGTGPTGPGGHWEIFSPEGDPLGSVEMPEGLIPYQVTSDRLVGVHRDELGVERVRVHRVERP